MKKQTILCYGDSNTWGYVPTHDYTVPKSRYQRNERWSGILQNLLGDAYYVIEEGLNSRTTNLDYFVPPDRNGKTYLAPCLYSHSPINLVILALGGNDMKSYFNRTPEQIKDGLAELIDIIQSSEYGPSLQQAPQILIMTPAIPLEFVENYKDENGILFLEGVVEKAKRLVPLYAQLANEKNCYFMDVSNIQPSTIDGVHYDSIAHRKLAERLYKTIKSVS